MSRWSSVITTLPERSKCNVAEIIEGISGIGDTKVGNGLPLMLSRTKSAAILAGSETLRHAMVENSRTIETLLQDRRIRTPIQKVIPE
jgi:hypothetical protein